MAEEPIDPRHENVWKGQEEEPMQMTLEEVCSRAHSFERKSVRSFWGSMAALGFVVVVSAIYIFQFSDPLIRIGNASALTIFLYLAVRIARHGPPRRLRAGAQAATCVDFLRSELEKKRELLLEFRMITLLLIPGLVALWWGGGPTAVAEWLGIAYPWLVRYQQSWAPLIVCVVLLIVIWFGSGREARELRREIERLKIQ